MNRNNQPTQARSTFWANGGPKFGLRATLDRGETSDESQHHSFLRPMPEPPSALAAPIACPALFRFSEEQQQQQQSSESPFGEPEGFSIIAQEPPQMRLPNLFSTPLYHMFRLSLVREPVFFWLKWELQTW